MKKILLLITCLALSAGVAAKGGRGGGKAKGAATKSTATTATPPGRDHPVRGHVKKDGAYVAPTRATNPNRTKKDNYSQKGNVNPANGNVGTKND